MRRFDFLIVGSGLFGAVFAYKAKQKGYSCLVVEKRKHVGGNVFCQQIEGINVHIYGPHIFHTSDSEVWNFVNQFVRFNRYVNSPMARYDNQLYSLPFNMNTFYQLWGVMTPAEARSKLKEQQGVYANIVPSNMEEQALKLVGRDIYERLIKGYTQKQWGCAPDKLPAFIIRRIPLRFTFDNNYFNDTYQGIPMEGYNVLINKLLEDVVVLLETDFFNDRAELSAMADKIVYTGMLDAYFDYCYGHLEYRSLRFETEILDVENYQGNAVINYTELDVPYTRVIEHKHFEFGQQPNTVITREYPQMWKNGEEAYYPINNDTNEQIAAHYRQLATQERNVWFGGRLADYKYYDMDQVIKNALQLADKIL